jgi:hypothetical protein
MPDFAVLMRLIASAPWLRGGVFFREVKILALIKASVSMSTLVEYLPSAGSRSTTSPHQEGLEAPPLTFCLSSLVCSERVPDVKSSRGEQLASAFAAASRRESWHPMSSSSRRLTTV